MLFSAFSLYFLDGNYNTMMMMKKKKKTYGEIIGKKMFENGLVGSFALLYLDWLRVFLL